MRKILRGTRGISPLIATLILIAATVAGGAVVFSVMRSRANMLTGGADLEVTNADIVVAGGTQLAIVTVKNSGATNLTDVTATIKTDDTDASISIGALSAGQSQSGENTTGTWTAGKTYIVKVTATSSDGSTVLKSLSALAHA